jgi:Tol biopolymer transport system component
VIRFDPTTATAEDPIVAATTNGQAAVVVDNPNAFPPGTDMVTIALSRESDDDVTVPGEFITDFQAYPIGIQILSDVDPDPNGGGLLIAVCVLDGAPLDVVIGHRHNGDVELLVPSDPDPESLGYIDCTDATGNTVVAVAEGPKWLQLASRVVQPVIKLLEPKPLKALMFAGRGLGGRTNQLSLDAAVDPTIYVGETVQLSVGTDAETWTSDDFSVATVDGTGLVTGVGAGTATITAEFYFNDVLRTWSAVVTVLPTFVPGMINFDYAPDGTPIASGTLVSDLYAPAGVTFGYGGTASTCGTNVYANGQVVPGLPTPSPPNRVSLCNEGTASDISENTYGFIVATFGPFVSEVCLDVSTRAGQSGFLAAYSQGGALLERATTPIGAVDATQELCVTRADPDIVAAAFSGDGSLFARFDNLDFVAGPGGSNQIAFVGSGDIRVMNANGTQEINLTGGVIASGRRPSWSPDGHRIAFDVIGGSGIYFINPDGSGFSGPVVPTGAWQSDWSPLGGEIAFYESGSIYVMNVDGTNVRLVTQGSGPKWSPDGTRIAYTLTVGGQQDIYTISSDGVGTPVNVTNSGLSRTPAWSPDGTQIAYAKEDALGNTDIWVINADGSGVPVNVTNTAADENQVDWSPDGTMLTFWSKRVGGVDQIFTQAADGSGVATQLTFGGVNFDPTWRPPVTP